MEGLIFILTAVIIMLNIISLLIYIDEPEWFPVNFYTIILFLPAFLVLGICFRVANLFGGLLTTKMFNPVKMFHKFMMQNPKELIKFRIKLERK